MMASPEDAIAGNQWYEGAHSEAVRIAALSGFSVSQASGIIAALSPMKAWADNLKLAERVALGDFSGHTGVQLDKCRAIIEGRPPEQVLGGRKTIAFYWSILNSGKCDHVTVDRHIISAAFGRKLTDRELATTHRPRTQYTQIERTVQSIASDRGAFAAQVQATIWTTWIKQNHKPARSQV
jgi:hypothetical protein